MPSRQELHDLIELLPVQELHAALRYLQFLCGHSPLTRKILVVDDPNHAPEAPESPEEQAAWKDYEAHLASSMKTLNRDLEDEE